MVFIYFVSVCELGLYRSHVHIIWSRCRRSVIKSLPVDMLSQALLLLSIMKSRQELPMSFFFLAYFCIQILRNALIFSLVRQWLGLCHQGTHLLFGTFLSDEACIISLILPNVVWLRVSSGISKPATRFSHALSRTKVQAACCLQ